MPVATSCTASTHASGHIVRVRCVWSFPTAAQGSLAVYRTSADGRLQRLRTSRGIYIVTAGGSSYSQVNDLLVGTGTGPGGGPDFSIDVIDYEPPQGHLPRYYFVATQGATVVTSSTAAASAQPSRGGDFLYDVSPMFATRARGVGCTVGEISDLEYASRDSVMQIIGRRSPVVVRDLRSNPTGKLTLITSTDAEARAMRAIVNGGNSLCLSPASSAYGIDSPLHFVATDVTESRVTRLGVEPTRRWTLEFLVIDPPPLYVGAVLDSAAYTEMVGSYSTYTPASYSTIRAPYGLGMAGATAGYDPSGFDT